MKSYYIAQGIKYPVTNHDEKKYEKENTYDCFTLLLSRI